MLKKEEARNPREGGQRELGGDLVRTQETRKGVSKERKKGWRENKEKKKECRSLRPGDVK